jgi:hypothetical protein
MRRRRPMCTGTLRGGGGGGKYVRVHYDVEEVAVYRYTMKVRRPIYTYLTRRSMCTGAF